MSGGLVATTVYADAEPPLDEASLPALHQELQWQRNDVRIFAHAAAETQVAIKDALAHKFNTARSGAADSIAAGVNDPGFLEVFPRVASRPPKLLQELEAILVDRLRANDKAASMTVLGSARERDPKLSANLSLDGHRQVMSAFIAGFSTYAPLLSRIQAEFDRALNEGVRSAQENVEMRYQMASNELARERATAEVRGQVLAEDLSFRAAALSKLQELRERAVRAEKKKLLAEKDLRDAQAEEARMRALVESLRGTNNKLQELLIEEDRWAAKPLSGHLVGMPIGPLTKADEEFLEQELGGMDTLAVTPSAAAAGAASAFKSSMSLARNNSGLGGLGAAGPTAAPLTRQPSDSPSAAALPGAEASSAPTAAGTPEPGAGPGGAGAQGESSEAAGPGAGGEASVAALPGIGSEVTVEDAVVVAAGGAAEGAEAPGPERNAAPSPAPEPSEPPGGS
ncbi:hypothetical protein CHLRE_14g618300v5 [Chlamydomonas reinhardtii]|uniref:Uncharacterized protein n=1 Tax=Chlamydomonas reinhardtii TaxID=3055 RepID=A0A2K3CXT5_CHLRE|nr:uncharacterized protein CHLRE_14g618300v5 [Chlamydomonas reinhardtii]PNW73083.1 hypothetical protein CHLRE_14g618300v5 [Chlamydomonas reinhardtii]